MEIQLYLNTHGIFGIAVAEDLEDLLVASVNTENYILEKLPVSKFHSGYTDLEYFLDEFKEVSDYIDSYYTCETFSIDNAKYFSIINLSDKNCIAVDHAKKTYMLNKETGQTKLLAKYPAQFITLIRNKEAYWLKEEY